MKTEDLEAGIIVCDNCGAKNRKPPHEAGQTLVCGNCRTTLAQEENPSNSSTPPPIVDAVPQTSEKTRDGREAVLYDHDGVCVTNATVHTENGNIIRVSDIQRIQVEITIDKEAKWYKRIAWVLAILGFAVRVMLAWPNEFSLNPSDFVLVEIPAIFFCVLYLVCAVLVGTVLAHCNSGVVEISRKFSRKRARFFGDEQWERDKTALNKLAEAVGEAMARSKS